MAQEAGQDVAEIAGALDVTDDYDVIMGRNEAQKFYFTQEDAWDAAEDVPVVETPRETFREFRSRIGRVVIPTEMMVDNIDLARRIMSGLFVVRVDKSTRGDDEYFACSDAFDKMPEGSMVPEYMVKIDEQTQDIEWERVEEKPPNEVIRAGLLSSLDNIRMTLEREDDNDSNSPVRRAWIENGDDERVMFYEREIK